MTLHASATTMIAATPQAVLEFVLDLDRYRHADDKITKVGKVTGPDDHGVGSAVMWGKMPGLPAARDRQNFRLERWSRLTFTGARRQPGRLVFDFVGTFDCEPVDAERTRLTHAYDFIFTKPFGWVERRLATTLDAQIADEVQRLAELVVADTSAETD